MYAKTNTFLCYYIPSALTQAFYVMLRQTHKKFFETNYIVFCLLCIMNICSYILYSWN